MVATNTRHAAAPDAPPMPPPRRTSFLPAPPMPPPRRTSFLPAPARLPAEPFHVVTDRDALLDLAQRATVDSYGVAGDRDAIERLGQAVADLVTELAKVEREREQARQEFAKLRALHADTKLELHAAEVAGRTLAERQRATTVVIVQQTTIVMAPPAPRSQSMIFDLSDADAIVLDEDQLPTPGAGQTRRMPAIIDVTSSAGGASW